MANAARESLENLGNNILNECRTQLYLSMHFMGAALGSLAYVMDLSTRTIGTDAAYIRFNPNFLMAQYLDHPRKLNRTYIHMLLHCLFLHMYHIRDYEDPELWNLCCDIAVESLIDTMGYDVICDVVTDRRSRIYETLQNEIGVLTAEKLYRYFSENPRDYNREISLAREFALDDHGFWERMEENQAKKQDTSSGRPELPPGSRNPFPDGSQNSPEKPGPNNAGNSALPDRRGTKPTILPRTDREDDWKKNAKRMETELVSFGKDASDEAGNLAWILSLELKEKKDFRDFLKRFFILREEARIDTDSFDYGFYNYGMQLYGNMPLIEENEYREASRVEELVIAIDTSASCQDTLVRKFLNETASILLSRESFFRKINIHIVECDDRMQQDIVIHTPKEMKRYAEAFSVKGGGGTDFRPVFRYVKNLRGDGTIKHLKGLMYFTDGFGTYPKDPTDYDTAFVFSRDDEYNDRDVPEWALKLYV